MAQTLIDQYQLQKYISPVEAPEIVAKKIKGLDELIANATLGVESSIREVLCAQRVQTAFPQIDVSFLSMNGGEPLVFYTMEEGYPKEYRIKITTPRFAVYNLGDPHFKIGGAVRINLFRGQKNPNIELSKEVITPKLPKDISGHLLKSVSVSYKKKGGLGYGRYNYNWDSETIFRGITSEEIKQIITQERSSFLEKMFIIAEAKEWVHDPLLIGEKEGKYYLLGQFECTPIEDYIMREFTTGSLKGKLSGE